MRQMSDPTKCQAEHYQLLLKEREKTPCSPKDAAGSWWCDKCEVDQRVTPCIHK